MVQPCDLEELPLLLGDFRLFADRGIVQWLDLGGIPHRLLIGGIVQDLDLGGVPHRLLIDGIVQVLDLGGIPHCLVFALTTS